LRVCGPAAQSDKRCASDCLNEHRHAVPRAPLFCERGHTPNENKMSDGGRGRALLVS
jgi:hypothetical protein